MLDSTAIRAIQAVSNGMTMLSAGFTMERDLGNNANYADTALRVAIEQGWVPGPTIINSGIIIGGFGGQFQPVPEREMLIYPEYINADTPDEIVKAVRRNILYGAKVIKICVDCKPYGYTVDEMKLFVSEAAKAGLKVAGHVQTKPGAMRAIEAGIFSIEHSGPLDDEAHKLMAKKGIWRVGTETPLTRQPANRHRHPARHPLRNEGRHFLQKGRRHDAREILPQRPRAAVRMADPLAGATQSHRTASARLL